MLVFSLYFSEIYFLFIFSFASLSTRCIHQPRRKLYFSLRLTYFTRFSFRLFFIHLISFIFIISSSIVISNANYKFHLSCLTLKLLKIETFRKILFLSRIEKSSFSRGRRGTDNKGRGEAMLINFVIAPRISDGRHIDGSRPTSRS